MNDLLTNNFTDEVNIQLLKKNLSVQKTLVTGQFVYALLSSIYWVNVLLRNIETGSSLPLTWYTKVYPVIALFIMPLYIVCSLLAFKGNRLIKLSIETKDVLLFNKGYHSFYNLSTLSLIATILSIATLTIDLLIK